MIDSAQIPALIVVIPLLSAFVVCIVGCFGQRLCQPFTVLALIGSWWASFATLGMVIGDGVIRYRLGGWPPPMGIEYVVDHLNALVLVVITSSALLVAVFSKNSVEEELPARINLFYTLYLLLVTGLLGMTITGDAFNLYVLLEISALTTYALITIGQSRALHASFNYLMMGTIGASFYLLGVGHLYIMTGSLNMADLAVILPDIYNSRAILAAFLLIMVGIWAKMAFFPMHSWLPNAYTYAPNTTSCLIAPLMTKISVYIMLRVMFSIFSPAYVYHYLSVANAIVWMAVIAIIGGSLLALVQKDFKKMLTYLVVAEVGYMVGGAWLANEYGITGAILHILNDALMTLCLFLAAGAIIYKVGGQQLDDLKGIFRRMPVTMTAFMVGALSMIGVPPTAGFFSKWYLILGGIEAARWEFVVALLFSSLVNAVLFFRIIEIGYFEAPEEKGINEAPLSMLGPLVLAAISLVVVGIYSGDIVSTVIQYAVPEGI